MATKRNVRRAADTALRPDYLAAAPAAPKRLIRIDEVLRQTGLTRSSLYRQIRRGNFDRPIALTERARAWDEAYVQRWVASRIEAGRAA